MHLYGITEHYYNDQFGVLEKDVGSVVAEDDAAVFDYVNAEYKDGSWESSGMTRDAVIAARGDRIPEDEFNDVKYCWTDTGEISNDEAARCKFIVIPPRAPRDARGTWYLVYTHADAAEASTWHNGTSDTEVGLTALTEGDAVREARARWDAIVQQARAPEWLPEGSTRREWLPRNPRVIYRIPLT